MHMRKFGAVSLPARTPLTTDERRAATAAMSKCSCGNICRSGDIFCDQCADGNERAIRAERDLRASARHDLLAELAHFDTTRFPGMEAEAVRQAARMGLDPVDLLLACEAILMAGLEEIAEQR